MTSSRFSALVVTIASILVLASAGSDAPSDVVTLTKDNFAEIIAKEPLVFVKFFAPWCGHCKAMADDFKSAATELKGKAVLADVDATVEEDLAKKYNIQGFPTLKVFADGQELTDYNGGRDKESMIKFIERATLPPFSSAEKVADYEKFIKKNEDKNILVGIELDTEQLSKFKKATFALRDIMPEAIEFVHASTVDAAKIDSGKKGDVYLLRIESDGKHKAVKYEGSDDTVTIEAFVKKSALPTFQELTQSNAELYTEMAHPLVIGFYDECTGHECKTLEKIANANANVDNLAFAWVNKVTLQSFMEYVGLKDAEVKIFAYSFADDTRFMLPEGFEFSEEALTSWVADLKDGKIEHARKSQQAPTQDSPVYKVVGDSWDAEVQNANKDVLVAQVAEWCGHCKALKPILAKVAEQLANAGIDHVRIAQMDATENDAPTDYKAKGFPTVHFFASGKGEGIEYDGDRTSKGIIDWIKEKTSKKFEFDSDSLGEDPTPEEEEEEEEGADEEDDGDDGESDVDEDYEADGEDEDGEEGDEEGDEEDKEEL